MIKISDQTRLYFYDHRPGKYDRERQAGNVALLDVSRLIKEAGSGSHIVNDRAEATHLIVHLNDFDRNRKALSGAWPDSARTDQIVLCLTGENRFDPNKFPHQKSQPDGFRRVTFFCRDAQPLKNVATFAAFCNLTVEEAEGIADGEILPSDANLRPVFAEVADAYLSALAILCQAYLVLYASVAPGPARGSAEVNETLEEMGLWAALSKSGELPLPANVQERFKGMTAPWWASALTGNESGRTGGDTLAVATRIKREWEGLMGAASDKSRSAYGWVEVELLIGAIGLGAGEVASPPPGLCIALEPEVVARAYRAVRGALTARN